MGKLAAFFMLLTFVSTLPAPSMFMLSIEQDRIYTEGYDLYHIINAAGSSPAEHSATKESGPGSGRVGSHRHIQVTRYTIPEKENNSVAAAGIAGAACLQPYPAFARSLGKGLFPHQPDPGRQLKLPITSLLQSSVLLI